MKAALFLSTAIMASAFSVRPGGAVWDRNQTEKAGLVWMMNNSASHDSLAEVPAGATRNWCNHTDGESYCTPMLNQHLPQYCGSCWAHGAISALGDRIKIARGNKGMTINLAVQHVLNCGNVGSCYGGSIESVYQWLGRISHLTGSGVSYYTSQPYVACSSDVHYGLCPGHDWSCTPANVARACGTFPGNGGQCVGVKNYPNATIGDFGVIQGVEAIKKEVYNRGPVACGVDALPLLKYASGIVTGPSGGQVDHVVSIVGFDRDPTTGQEYWIVRNSWGEYWGEMGFFRIEMGRNVLQIESMCSWAVPQTWTDAETNLHCSEDGTECHLSGLGGA